MKEFELSRSKKVATINLLSNGNDRRVFQNVFDSDWKKLEYSIPEESELTGSVSDEFPHLSELTEQFPHLDGANFGEWIDTLVKNGKGNILHYGKPTEWTIAKDIIDKYDARIRNYTKYDVLDMERQEKGVQARYAQYYRKEGTWNEFDPEIVGKYCFDVVFAQNISGHSAQPFDVVKKLYDTAAPNGLLFVHGIVVDSGVADTMVKRWQDTGHQFAFSKNTPSRDLFSNGFTILNITMRKTSDVLVTPEPSDKLIKARGTIYPIISYSL